MTRIFRGTAIEKFLSRKITNITKFNEKMILLELLPKYFNENKSGFIVKTENIWRFCRMGKDEDDM